MRAMVLKKIGEPLILEDVPCPEVGPYDVLIEIHACGVCRTDLHIFEGELHDAILPLIMGHQIVGTIKKMGKNVQGLTLNTRVGVPWLQKTCTQCQYCLLGKENLCDQAIFTGYQINGGFAEYCIADQNAVYLLPSKYDDAHVAPLLCAGLIGYRAYRLAGKVEKIAFYGFGSAAHILTQVLVHQGIQVYAFTREGDHDTQEFARRLGVSWAGDLTMTPPTLVDAAIIFAPLGALMIEALKIVKKGGSVISAGIHMSDIPAFPYALLWGERTLTSVANLTRKDGEEFLKLAEKITIHTEIATYSLADANKALYDLKHGANLSPSIVLII
jgi:propanol-preferring alcohol dehydrogenase